jgi:enediyne biosynthesis protein E4
MMFPPCRTVTALLILGFFSSALDAQTPTGKTYSTEARRQTSPAQQFPSPITFANATATSGIAFRHNASPTSLKYLAETMGGGVALFDFDNDGRLDVYFTNGAQILEPMPNGKQPEKTDPKYWNRLYRQRTDGTFDDVTVRAGVKGDGYGFGVAAGDYDRDGFCDLFVTRFGGASLFRNNGNGTFSEATKKAGLGGVDGWPTSSGFFDYDNDGRLDLFVARYVAWDFEKGALYCGDLRPGYRSYCHPDNFPSTSSLLFHQKADGTFEDVSERSGIAKSKGKALGVAFGDFDNDGRTDVFVANDNSEQQLFRNRGDGTFEDVALAAGVAFNENGNRFSGMGIDAADYDNDGAVDTVITVLSNETYPLYRNRGEWFFDYVTQTSGVGQISVLGTGWGIKFVDVDDDGRRDILAAQGHVLDTIERMSGVLKYKQPPLLMRNAGKEFQDVSVSSGDVFQTGLAARGMACGDLDNDGYVDAVIAQVDGPAVLLRNLGPKSGMRNHWIGLDLRGNASAPNGEGARVAVIGPSGRTQIFYAGGTGSYLAASDPRVLIGLGGALAARVEIKWPSGRVQILENPVTDRYHRIMEK